MLFIFILLFSIHGLYFFHIFLFIYLLLWLFSICYNHEKSIEGFLLQQREHRGVHFKKDWKRQRVKNSHKIIESGKVGLQKIDRWRSHKKIERPVHNGPIGRRHVLDKESYWTRQRLHCYYTVEESGFVSPRLDISSPYFSKKIY